MRKSILLSLALVLATTPALARGGARPSPEEIAARRSELFAAADADGDGALDPAEFTTFTELVHAERREHHFHLLDRDADGLLSSEELARGDHPPPHGGRP